MYNYIFYGNNTWPTVLFGCVGLQLPAVRLNLQLGRPEDIAQPFYILLLDHHRAAVHALVVVVCAAKVAYDPRPF